MSFLVFGLLSLNTLAQLIAQLILASTPGLIFAFTLDLAKIRPGIDCMLENMLPSLINRAHEVSLAFHLIKCSKHV